MSERQEIYRYRVDREEAEKLGKRHQLAGDLSYQHPEPDDRYPNRHLILSSPPEKLHLSKEQALALLHLLLDDLPRLAKLEDDDELREIHRVHWVHTKKEDQE